MNVLGKSFNVINVQFYAKVPNITFRLQVGKVVVMLKLCVILLNPCHFNKWCVDQKCLHLQSPQSLNVCKLFNIAIMHV